MSDTLERFFNVNEAAAFLSVSKHFLYKWIDQVPHYRMGSKLAFRASRAFCMGRDEARLRRTGAGRCMSLRRIVFTIDETRAAEIEAYAMDHGYASAGDFSRVATLRIMSMYPSKKAATRRDTAGSEITAPGVPRQRQNDDSAPIQSAS